MLSLPQAFSFQLQFAFSCLYQVLFHAFTVLVSIIHEINSLVLELVTQFRPHFSGYFSLGWHVPEPAFRGHYSMVSSINVYIRIYVSSLTVDCA